MNKGYYAFKPFLLGFETKVIRRPFTVLMVEFKPFLLGFETDATAMVAGS